MNFNLRRDWPVVAAIAVTFLATLVAYPWLPDPMPTHWNFAGQPDDYSSRLVGAWLVPVLMVGVQFLLIALPRIDPRRANVARFDETYRLLRTAITLFLGATQLVVLGTVVSGRDELVGSLIPMSVGLLLLVMGNYLPRIQSNWFMGIRTPWTLSSDRVWRATHRMGGRMFMIAGLLLLLSPLVPSAWRGYLLPAVIVLAALAPTAYSYWVFRQAAADEA